MDNYGRSSTLRVHTTIVKKMAESGDDLTNCSVCFESYRESGDHVPRVLPCFHTLCEKCIKELLDKNTVTCPECRTQHPAGKVEKQFPQNKYVLTFIRRRQKDEAIQAKTKMCKDHGKELCFYCKDTSCQTAICPGCLLNEHRLHEVVDLQQELKEKRELLLVNLDTLTANLHRNKQIILNTKREINRKYTMCIEPIENKKTEHLKIITQTYDKLLKDAYDQTTETNNSIYEELAEIHEHLTMVDSIKENTDKATVTYEEITEMLNTFETIKIEVASNASIIKSFKYQEYNDSKVTDEDVETLCGYLTEKEMLIDTSQTKDQSLSDEETDERFSWKVTRITCTSFNNVKCLAVPGDKYPVICGEENGQWKLTRYNPQCEKAISSTILQVTRRFDGGMTDVVVDGKPCVAYRNKGEIEVRDVSNLDEVTASYFLESTWPGQLYNSPPSTLLFEDQSRYPRLVRWLDCSASPPEFVNLTHVHSFITGMCCVQHKGRQLVITTRHEEGTFDGTTECGIRAYNSTTDELEWSLAGYLPGMDRQMHPSDVTTDGRGHLFVCDVSNACVQMFSTNGRFIETFDLDVLKDTKHCPAVPHCIRWLDHMSSLIIVFENSKKYYIAAVKVEEI